MVGMNKILAHLGTPIGLMWAILFKQTTYISRVLTRPERSHKILFSQSALTPQICLRFSQKLKYFINKDCSRKLVAVAINVNAREVKGTVSPLRNARVLLMP